jgi:uncharacterized protein YdhG (YjbR/CyaY superfamily)
MQGSRKAFKTIDEYISAFPMDVQAKLQEMRDAIHECAPEATEAISYSMPTFKLNGNLVHFAAFQHHIGFFPTASGVEEFEKKLSRYKHSKGAIQFPLNEELPLDLVREIVKYRVAENKAKVKKGKA